MTVTLQHPPSVLAYFKRVEAEILNFRRAVIKIHRGPYYIEKATIKIWEDGNVTCSVKEHAPWPEELEKMKEELAGVNFPKAILANNTDELRKLVNGPIYEFWDYNPKEGEPGIIMVQERVDFPKKHYVPWTKFSDGRWCKMEPDRELPFWRPKPPANLVDQKRQIMIHEGAKAAAHVTQMLADGGNHPWAEFLSDYEHWGMIGGALAPQRTDYSEIGRFAPSGIVYACDHDRPGESVLKQVSKKLKKQMKGLVFGNNFPSTWDMADEMPKDLFSRRGRYVGPQIKEMLVPATWATEQVPQADKKGEEGKGRPMTVINPEFAEEWMHCVIPEVFVHRDWPHNLYSMTEFDSKVRPFSHVDQTGRLLKQDFGSKATVIKYTPGFDTGIYSGSTQDRYINSYCTPKIEAEAGDPKPFLDFMETLLPDPTDRHEVMRWCATLIARPDIKMTYGLLCVSEMQGVGKGTLGEKILSPLIGESNVSYPSESELVESQYNYWLAHKRLAVVHEIYAGQSAKAYNKLKSIITDKYITVSKKYQANYMIENWVHIFACSNSLRALRIAIDDRRWYIPKIGEKKRGVAYWEEFNQWLVQDGGLSIIRQWALDFVQIPGNLVLAGADAPNSSTKKAMIEEGYSPGQQLVHRTLTRIKDLVDEGKLERKNAFLLDTDLVTLIRNQIYKGEHNDRLERPMTVRTVAKGLGWSIGDTQAYVRSWGSASAGARVLSLDPHQAELKPGEIQEHYGSPLDPASFVDF